jgi:subtilisin family serine protease
LESQKLDNQLSLALEATKEERERSISLSTGYNAEEKTWELIVEYSGDLAFSASQSIQVTELSGGYAILVVPESQIEQLTQLPQIEYIEKPRRLYFSRITGKSVSCMTAVQRPPLNLSGRGVLTAILDSGVDVRHPEFRYSDGTTRILALWDQTLDGTPPEGYHIGSEYSKEQINELLRQDGEILPGRDISGHGTGVLAIAAGNGGVAYESDLLVVKLGTPMEGGFPRTTELMQGLDYVVRKALSYRMPVAVNISFGNSYGSHRGTSLLETYLDLMSGRWKSVICVGSGNEGAGNSHTSGRLNVDEIRNVEFIIGDYETGLGLQIWKNYVDTFDIYLIHPNGTSIGPLAASPPAQRYRAGQTELLIYYGEPAPYSVDQEIYVDFIPIASYVDSGVWNLRLVPRKIVDGVYQMWLPGSEVIGMATRFLTPVESNTLTIPSTASGVITVGAYDALTGAYADFSGRGLPGVLLKPDLVAPGVNIETAVPGGGYQPRTGTSFATPFVTGAAALLMQYGIVDGRDPYLYGEKVKAYLQRGARELPGFKEYPNYQVGYGALCVGESIPG